VLSATSSRTRSSGRLRALAIRGTWNSAASGEMSGSSLLAELVTRSMGTEAVGFSLLSVSMSPCAVGDEKHVANYAENAQRHDRSHRQRGNVKYGAHQCERVGKIDMRQRNIHQTIQDRIVSDIAGIEAKLDQKLFEPEILRGNIQRTI
jgi:hypothetical protein